jgi:hypothetical protein
MPFWRAHTLQHMHFGCSSCFCDHTKLLFFSLVSLEVIQLRLPVKLQAPRPCLCVHCAVIVVATLRHTNAQVNTINVNE